MSTNADTDDLNSEARRLAALTDYGLLDTPGGPRLEAIVQEAAERFDAPMSTITLIDRDRQWFKAQLGMSVSETPLEDSICAHVVRSGNVLVVENAAADERFAGIGGVKGEEHIRFYAGAPLTLASGTRVGTLCVIDRVPRDDFDGPDRQLLAQLARRTVAEFELERDLRDAAPEAMSTGEWLNQASSLLSRASAALERGNATAELAMLEEVIDRVEQLRDGS